MHSSLLVHVVTHADCQVSLQLPDGKVALARPHYSHYDTLCSSLYNVVQQCLSSPSPSVSSAPSPSPPPSPPPSPSGATPTCSPITISSSRGSQPIGLRFESAVPIGLFDHWRFRSRDRVVVPKDEVAYVCAVYFPLISIVLPLWIHLCSLSNDMKTTHAMAPISDDSPALDASHASPTSSPSRSQFLYLVSGSTMPRVPPLECSGNSTLNLARLMTLYVSMCFPSIESNTVDSGDGGLFSFYRNIQFMQSVLNPLVAAKRREVANAMGEHWPEHFSLMLTLKSDTAARTSALMTNLRPMRPDYLHISEMQSFWYGFPNIDSLWEHDIEFLPFDQVEYTPARAVSEVSPDLQLLVKEMVRHKIAFEQSIRKSNEQRKFWLRKTNKPVLSVLMVQKDGCTPSFYTGINIEVSMPTGSLCAERNAIGTCLATDPSIRRGDMVAMAVLSMSLPSTSRAETTFGDSLIIPSSGLSAQSKVFDTPPSSPDLCSWDEKRVRARKTRSQSMVTEDPVPRHERAQNPINPCGACKEWLKKIAICNPDFKVVTFRSMHCDQVYVQSVLR